MAALRIMEPRDLHQKEKNEKNTKKLKKTSIHSSVR